jgi:hypothetical protein
MADAEDGVVRQAAHAGLAHGQPRVRPWRAALGLPLHMTQTHRRHPRDGAPPGRALLGFPIRPDRVGTHHAGTGPRGHQQRGGKPRLTPAKVNVQAPLAARGRRMRRRRAWPQAAWIRPRPPTSRGGATDARAWVRHATFRRVDHRMGATRRPWARQRHPHAAAGWG